MESSIFKRGSTTYYWSSKFFPKEVRADVFKLYSFVRVADDFVDQQPQDIVSFMELKNAYINRNKTTDPTINKVVQNIHSLTKKYDFDPKWIKAFLASMESDTTDRNYATLDESLEYVYGSAEVIGLMMSKIFSLPEEAYLAARAQGRAMQWINFIRDIAEDNRLGRLYFPEEDLKRFGLKNLSEAECSAKPKAFEKCIQLQINRYKKWQAEAEAGYKYIPKRLRISVQTASSMYNWTARQIEQNPFIVFQKKVKPTKFMVVFQLVTNSF